MVLLNSTPEDTYGWSLSCQFLGCNAYVAVLCCAASSTVIDKSKKFSVFHSALSDALSSQHMQMNFSREAISSVLFLSLRHLNFFWSFGFLKGEIRCLVSGRWVSLILCYPFSVVRKLFLHPAPGLSSRSINMKSHIRLLSSGFKVVNLALFVEQVFFSLSLSLCHEPQWRSGK